MPFQISPAQKSDIPTLTSLYMSANLSPLALKVKSSIPTFATWYQNNLETDINKPHTHIYKLVDSESGEIIAFGKWNSPHTASAEDGDGPGLPTEGDTKLFEEFAGLAKEEKKRIMGDEEYWYLSTMATLPAHQRRGAASVLMTEFCKQADGTGQRSYLEASPKGLGLYLRFGFEAKGEFSLVVDGEPYANTCMVREPRRLA